MKTWPIVWFSWLKATTLQNPHTTRNRGCMFTSARLVTDASLRFKPLGATEPATRDFPRLVQKKSKDHLLLLGIIIVIIIMMIIVSPQAPPSPYNYQRFCIIAATALGVVLLMLNLRFMSVPYAGQSSHLGKPWGDTWEGTEILWVHLQVGQLHMVVMEALKFQKPRNTKMFWTWTWIFRHLRMIITENPTCFLFSPKKKSLSSLQLLWWIAITESSSLSLTVNLLYCYSFFFTFSHVNICSFFTLIQCYVHY